MINSLRSDTRLNLTAIDVVLEAIPSSKVVSESVVKGRGPQDSYVVYTIERNNELVRMIVEPFDPEMEDYGKCIIMIEIGGIFLVSKHRKLVDEIRRVLLESGAKAGP